MFLFALRNGLVERRTFRPLNKKQRAMLPARSSSASRESDARVWQTGCGDRNGTVVVKTKSLIHGQREIFQWITLQYP